MPAKVVAATSALRNLTSAVEVISETPGAAHLLLMIQLGDGTNDLTPAGGVFEVELTIGGRKVQPTPLLIEVAGGTLTCELGPFELVAPDSAAVAATVKSPNASDTNVRTIARLYDVGPVVVNEDGYVTLTPETILAVWHQLLSEIVTADTIGKLLKDRIDAAITSRLAPTSAGRTLDIAADGVAEANVVQIDGAATNDNLATLKLRQLHIVNSAGDAVVAQATGGDGCGISATGHGAGHGIEAVAGATGQDVAAELAAANFAGDVDVYRAVVEVHENDETDEYRVVWLKNGVEVARVNVADPELNVFRTSDGGVVIDGAVMEWDDADGALQYSAIDDERNATAEIMKVQVSATIDGATRTDVVLHEPPQ